MRQHSIKTTYLVHKTLVENSDITTLIGGAEHIQLLIGNPNINTVFPIINIKRENITPDRGNKDFWPDNVSFSIKIYSDNYEQSVNIADAIRFAIEGKIIQDDILRLQNIVLASAGEAYYDDAVEQSLYFSAQAVNPIINNS